MQITESNAISHLSYNCPSLGNHRRSAQISPVILASSGFLHKIVRELLDFLAGTFFFSFNILGWFECKMVNIGWFCHVCKNFHDPR